MKKLKVIGWLVRKLNILRKLQEIREDRGVKAAWNKHGYTVRTMDGGVLHFADYKEAAETLSALYETTISVHTLRHAVERDTHVVARYAIATIKRRGEK